MRDHGATSTTVQTPPSPVLAFTCRRPSRSIPWSSSPSGRTSASCWPPDSVSSSASSLSLSTGAGSSASFGPSAVRRRPASANGSRKRELAAPGAAADERRRQRDLPQEPLTALRPPEQPLDEDRERTPQCELVPDRLGKLERLDDLGRGPSPPHAPAVPSSRQAPGAPPVRPQSFGYGAARKPSKLTDLAHAELLELASPLLSERKQRERKRREELARALVGNDQHLPGARHVRRSECGKPAPGRAGAWIPGRADGGEGAPKRRLHAAVKTFDATRLEVDAAEVARLDREAAVLEPPQDLLPGLLGRGRVLVDEDELRARGERLPHAHARLDPLGLGRSRHRAEQRLLALGGRERCRAQGKARAGAQCRAELEARNEDAGHHRTYVLHEHVFAVKTWKIDVCEPSS